MVLHGFEDRVGVLGVEVEEKRPRLLVAFFQILD